MLQVTAQGLAQDARVIMVTGDVHLVRDLGGTSSRSPLATGQEIRVGDLVATGGQGRAQLRFSDGAVGLAMASPPPSAPSATAAIRTRPVRDIPLPNPVMK